MKKPYVPIDSCNATFTLPTPSFTPFPAKNLLLEIQTNSRVID